MNIVDLDKLCERFWDGNFMEIHKDDIPSIPSAFKGMTNGEVMKAVFPNAVIRKDDSNLFIEVLFSDEFWDSPYKGVSE